MFIKKLGIDLGTANTLVLVPGKGVILNEPSVVAVSVTDNKVLAVGDEAKIMIGRTPENIVAHRPLKDGVIADYGVTQAMLKYFISKALGNWNIIKPEVIVSAPAGVTSTERRAVLEAAQKAGAKQAFVVKEPILAAIGAGIAIQEPAGHMIVDIGGGTSDVAVISLGGIVISSSVKVAGNKLDQAISDYIKKKFNLAIGDRTAEDLKIQIGAATPIKEKMTMSMKGRDNVSGLPRSIEVTTDDIVTAISDELQEIVTAIKQVLRETPPELAADIIDRGICLSGGGALLRNMAGLIQKETGVPAFVAKDPLLCVAYGTGITLEHLGTYKKSIMSK